MLTNVLKGWRRQRAAQSPAWTTEPQLLIDVCERYWASPWEMISADAGDDGLQSQYDRARKELLERPETAVAWAIGLASLPEPQTRTMGVEMLAQAAHSDCLTDYRDAALEAFIETLDRPLRSRWDQIALEAAIAALGTLGDARALSPLTRLLLSDDREYQGDTHWGIAAALEHITGQSFLHTSNPVEAARSWARQSA